MARKTTLCPTCGASLTILRGEIFSCPECGMPIESQEVEPNEEAVEEEDEVEEDWE